MPEYSVTLCRSVYCTVKVVAGTENDARSKAICGRLPPLKDWDYESGRLEIEGSEAIDEGDFEFSGIQRRKHGRQAGKGR